MNVALDRCPEPIQRFVADSECGKCGTKPGTGLAVVVRYQAPMYVVELTCLKHGGRAQSTFIGPAPAAEAVPAIEMPSWYAHVEVAK